MVTPTSSQPTVGRTLAQRLTAAQRTVALLGDLVLIGLTLGALPDSDSKKR